MTIDKQDEKQQKKFQGFEKSVRWIHMDLWSDYAAVLEENAY